MLAAILQRYSDTFFFKGTHNTIAIGGIKGILDVQGRHQAIFFRTSFPFSPCDRILCYVHNKVDCVSQLLASSSSLIQSFDGLFSLEPCPGCVCVINYSWLVSVQQAFLAYDSIDRFSALSSIKRF